MVAQNMQWKLSTFSYRSMQPLILTNEAAQVIVQNGIAPDTITSNSSAFLDVVIHISRWAEVIYGAYVRNVNPHAKGSCTQQHTTIAI